MLIGVPREVKDHEYRAGLTPAGAGALAGAGHRVLIESDAGARAGFANEAYCAAGGEIVRGAGAAYAADLASRTCPRLEILHIFA